MFQGCTNIISIDFSNIEMNCDKMDFMFEGCSKLEKIELKNVQTSNVEDMSSMFNGCINLKFINLLSFDTSKVISMESMFKNCQSLKIIDLSNFKTPKLINMKSMFENCNQLKHLNIENFSTENCQNYEYIFKQCENLDEIDLLNYKGKDIFVSISKHINLRKRINDFSEIEKINNNLNINNIQYIYQKETNKPKRILEDNFNYSNNITFKVKGLTDEWIRPITSNYYTNGNCRVHWRIQMSATWIREQGTGSCYANHMIEITIPRGKTYIYTVFFSENLTSLSNMFQNSERMISADFSNFDFSLVTDVTNMFQNCKYLEWVNFGNTDRVFSNLIKMEGMFSNCYLLTSIDISKFDTKNVDNMNYMFSECRSLTSLNLRTLTTSNVKEMNSMFYGCRNLNSTDFLSELDTSKIKLWLQCFMDVVI